MGEPAVPDERDRGEALGLAVEVLHHIRDDEELPELDDRRVWLLAGTLLWSYQQLAAQRGQIEQLERELAAEKNAVIAAIPSEAERQVLRWIREHLERVEDHDIRLAAARELVQRLLTMKVNHAA